GQEVEWITEVTKYLAVLTKRPIIPIVQACSVPEMLDNLEFANVLDTGLAEPSSGVIIFTLDYLKKENKLGVMQTVFIPKIINK
ncbi:MAG: hypothetical protein QME64_06220, partial [bacterium]|nr:hypothetical protein [bacterium]